MYCKKCGKKLGENERFCSACGEPAGTPYIRQPGHGQMQNSQPREPYGRDRYTDRPVPSEQPTKALVVEGIGFLFFIYLLIANSRNDFETELWLTKHGAGTFFIGLFFIVISYFMLRKYKKKHRLYGIGYAGYVISCIGGVLMLIMLALAVLSFLPMMLVNF